MTRAQRKQNIDEVKLALGQQSPIKNLQDHNTAGTYWNDNVRDDNNDAGTETQSMFFTQENPLPDRYTFEGTPDEFF